MIRFLLGGSYLGLNWIVSTIFLALLLTLIPGNIPGRTIMSDSIRPKWAERLFQDNDKILEDNKKILEQVDSVDRNVKERIYEIDERVTKVGAAVLKLKTMHEKDRHQITSLTREQFQIKKAIERVHKLVEKIRTETIQDRMEAKREERNVVFNTCKWAEANANFSGARSAKNLKAFAYAQCKKITDEVKFDYILSCRTYKSYAGRDFFRLQIELPSPHLASVVANVGRKRGINVRVGKPKNDREFLKAKHDLVRALNADEDEAIEGKRFEISGGSRIVIVDNETNEVEKEVHVGNSKEYADCQLRLDLDMYQDVADDDEEGDGDNPYLSDMSDDEGEDEERMEFGDQQDLITKAQQKQATIETRKVNRQVRLLNRGIRTESNKNIRGVPEEPNDESQNSEQREQAGPSGINLKELARTSNGAPPPPIPNIEENGEANNSVVIEDEAVIGSQKVSKRAREPNQDKETEKTGSPPSKRQTTSNTKKGAGTSSSNNQGNQKRAPKDKNSTSKNGPRMNARIASDLPVFDHEKSQPASDRDFRAIKRHSNFNVTLSDNTRKKVLQKAMEKKALEKKRLLHPLVQPSTTDAASGNGAVGRD